MRSMAEKGQMLKDGRVLHNIVKEMEKYKLNLERVKEAWEEIKKELLWESDRCHLEVYSCHEHSRVWFRFPPGEYGELECDLWGALRSAKQWKDELFYNLQKVLKYHKHRIDSELEHIEKYLGDN